MSCGDLTVKVVRLELRVSVTEKTEKLGFESAKAVAAGSEIIIYVNEKYQLCRRRSENKTLQSWKGINVFYGHY